MTDLHHDTSSGSRSSRLDRAIRDLLAQTPELEAAAVVSFDGLPMAAALPPSMDEDRVAAMSAALLSLGERAAQGLGRGELSQVYIEGDDGTVFLVSADDEAVLVAVASKGAKAGMMLYEVRRTAAVVASVLRAEEAPEPVLPALAVVPPVVAVPEPVVPLTAQIPTQVPAQSASAAAWAPAPSTHDQYAAPSYAEPVDAYQVPVYELPAFGGVPAYDTVAQELPVHDAPLHSVPLHAAPQHVEPAPVPQPATAPEPVWPVYAPTGSVMPGGGVPPSTWS